MNEMRQGFSIRQSLFELDAAHREAAQHRLAYLETGLAYRGFSLRDDSRLAFLWATEGLDPTWTDEEVLHEMMCVQFICANTDYSAVLQPCMRELAGALKEKWEKHIEVICKAIFGIHTTSH